ncbi:MAG TPA: hypothetical protein PKD20_05290 [Candidatus Saccharibacteria bacterium]|jgi:hypothetical protein|nr:hypothetical protein [Candidatus Saccharibacteria bacterium]HMT56256.1 hypothetical protein [Candidatus Saccharibacteria bacterium]
MSYHYKTGVFKTFLQSHLRLVIAAVTALFISSLMAATLDAKASQSSEWRYVPVAGSKIVFSCLGKNSLYTHTLKTVVYGDEEAFTGTGEYDADTSYKWDIMGDLSSNKLNATITYTGTSAGSVYHLIRGKIAKNGSVSGKADSNCQSFTMPAGSFKKVRVSEIDVRGNTGTENQKGAWMFGRDLSTTTDFQFKKGNASLHKGSLHVGPILNLAADNTTPDNQDKFVGEFFARESVANFDSLSYDFKIAGSGTNASANQFYVNFYVTLADNTDFRDCRFDFVPSVGSTTGYTTFSVNKNTVATAVGAKSGVTCPNTLAGMPAGSYIRSIALNVGDTSGSDTNLEGYFDNVVYRTADKHTTYDFEQSRRGAKDKDECKHDGWKYGADDEEESNFRNQGDCVSHFEYNHGHMGMPRGMMYGRD